MMKDWFREAVEVITIELLLVAQISRLDASFVARIQKSYFFLILVS